MNYFKIENTTDKNQIGLVYPQISEMGRDYDYDSSDSVTKLVNCSSSFPKFKPNLDSLILNKKSKLSDVLSTGFLLGNGFFISEKMKLLLSNFNICNHIFYEANVILNNKTYKYYYLHIVGNFENNINYSKSEFSIKKIFDKQQGEIIGIKNFDDYLIQKNKINDSGQLGLLSIRLTKIVFNSSFNSELDFFEIGVPFENSFFISNRLKEKLEEEKISGFDFISVNLLKSD